MDEQAQLTATNNTATNTATTAVALAVNTMDVITDCKEAVYLEVSIIASNSAAIIVKGMSSIVVGVDFSQFDLRTPARWDNTIRAVIAVAIAT